MTVHKFQFKKYHFSIFSNIYENKNRTKLKISRRLERRKCFYQFLKDLYTQIFIPENLV